MYIWALLDILPLYGDQVHSVRILLTYITEVDFTKASYFYRTQRKATISGTGFPTISVKHHGFVAVCSGH